MSRLLFLSIFIFLLQGCSSSGGNTDPVKNSNGFADVAGTYSFITKEIDFTCTDNSSGTIPALSLTSLITQTDNEITIAPPSGTDTSLSGLSQIVAGDNTGSVESNGDFTTSKFMTAFIDQLKLNASIQYSVTGKFTNTGWSGDYRYVVTLTDISVTCDYVTTFSGSKNKSSLKSLNSQLDKNIYYESEFYLELSNLGLFL